MSRRHPCTTSRSTSFEFEFEWEKKNYFPQYRSWNHFLDRKKSIRQFLLFNGALAIQLWAIDFWMWCWMAVAQAKRITINVMTHELAKSVARRIFSRPTFQPKNFIRRRRLIALQPPITLALRDHFAFDSHGDGREKINCELIARRSICQPLITVLVLLCCRWLLLLLLLHFTSDSNFCLHLVADSCIEVFFRISLDWWWCITATTTTSMNYWAEKAFQSWECWNQD